MVKVVACASKDYLQKRGAPLNSEDLLHHDLVVGENSDQVIAGFESSGHSSKQLKIVARCDDKNAQWACVKAGMGVGFMGDYLLKDDKDVVHLLPELRLPSYPIWLTAHRELRTSKRIRATFDFLAAEFEAQFRSPVECTAH
jgi:DNA-binding transcriptional LysR family regulator